MVRDRNGCDMLMQNGPPARFSHANKQLSPVTLRNCYIHIRRHRCPLGLTWHTLHACLTTRARSAGCCRAWGLRVSASWICLGSRRGEAHWTEGHYRKAPWSPSSGGKGGLQKGGGGAWENKSRVDIPKYYKCVASSPNIGGWEAVTCLSGDKARGPHMLLSASER